MGWAEAFLTAGGSGAVFRGSPFRSVVGRIPRPSSSTQAAAAAASRLDEQRKALLKIDGERENLEAEKGG